MNGNCLGQEKHLQKPGDWRVWQERYFEENKRACAAESKLRQLEWEPEHLWRSIWRYWFGGVENHQIHVGHLITISNWKGHDERSRDRIFEIFLFHGAFCFTKCKCCSVNYAKVVRSWTIKFKNSDHYRLEITSGPFKIKTIRIDKDAPSCG